MAKTKGDIIKELDVMLSVNFSGRGQYPEGSIMGYETICNHDDGAMCEHRKCFILKYLKDNL